MRNKLTTLIIAVFSLLGETVAQEQNSEHTLKLAESATSPAAKIEDVAWLQGYWKGEGLGGTCEEMWSAPLGGAMVGTFRLLNENQLTFSEFFILAEQEGSLVLKLKHFDPAFKGWEEQEKFVAFPFIRAEGTTAWFNGLTYQLADNGELHVYVAIHGKDGSSQEGEFHYKRQPLGN